MSKATITITETGDGSISVNIEFDPPAKTNDDTSLSQSAALQMVTLFSRYQAGEID